ncbi:helix-turn-helix domain-containing protein [Mycobacteroides abscessus]|uniref:helix-turn-helix domain-containing protein n=1 Tax=Mycobacteroides abscessus TaxID=36809 RepID=UPI0009282141|nr:helix-turn-helix transcriptional regulator [Mycobacteroides abscessus]SIG32194.1 DNA-binding protein [Mycobacteroides abscessus subsp. abscessus]SIG44109.1 DNA-binding protein [Mycobacteroides abscessus subsp. abscessus]SIM97717.1 DNA-binding protein [Mycobacteroides abscessus subsp. abscessus]SIN10705.1 DNA-binding protein [Mycobacteroides abscessus subsp. abscessus]SIN15057.1 DNA-binding protein [Mycobacteroides abscessus subsp. abscessus]
MGEEKPERRIPTRVTDADAAVGAVLLRLREQSGISVREVEQRTGISRSVLSRIERGERPARVLELEPLAQVYEMTIENLITTITADPDVRAASSK